MNKRHVRLTLIESARRVMPWLFTPWQLTGVGSITAVMGTAIVLTAVPSQLPAPALDALARFIAPPKQSGSAPSIERLSYVGLGTHTQQVLGEFKVPEPDGTVPVAANVGGDQGLYEEPTPEVLTERPLTEIEVDSVAALDPTAVGPDYPTRMLEKNIEGMVLAQFVVDSLGHADIATFKLLEPAEPDFVLAVKAALPRMKYRPASLGGRAVSQLVQQPFGFRIRPPGAG
jgi:protein TonB